MTDILRSTDIRPSFELIPPTSPEFTVYGCPDTVERARTWALQGRYLLARGLPACAHGMYLMGMCPTRTGPCCEAFDHTNLWIPDRSPGARSVTGDGLTDPPQRPFLLTHPYHKEIPAPVHDYARAHGLQVSSWPAPDGWYGRGTVPIRLSLPDSWPMWPIEREADAMASASPVIWPKG